MKLPICVIKSFRAYATISSGFISLVVWSHYVLMGVEFCITQSKKDNYTINNKFSNLLPNYVSHSMIFSKYLKSCRILHFCVWSNLHCINYTYFKRDEFVNYWTDSLITASLRKYITNYEPKFYLIKRSIFTSLLLRAWRQVKHIKTIRCIHTESFSLEKIKVFRGEAIFAIFWVQRSDRV